MVNTLQAFFKKFLTTTIAAAMVVFLFGVQTGHGQSTLLEYFNVADSQSQSPTNVATGLIGTDADYTAGSTSFGSVTAASWARPLPYFQGNSGWGEGNSGDAKNLFYTINLDGAESFTLSELSFEERATGAGPSAITVTINDVEVFSDDVPDSDTRLHTIDLSGFAQFVDISSATVRIKGWDNESRGTTGGGQWRINGIIVEGTVELPEDPLINSSPSSLSGFAYGEGSGPSDEQTFTVEGLNLEGDITVSPPANFEISETSGSGFVTGNITLTESEGSVSETTIFVRLAAGLGIDTYSGNVTLSSQNADDATVALSGEVVEAFAIPYFNGLRTEADFDLAVAQGFNFVDASLSTAVGGRIDIATDGFIETPEIDFTQFDEIRTTFDLRNLGQGSDRELTVKVSNDGGANFTDVEIIPINSTSEVTFDVDIDVTGPNNVTNGMIRFEKTGGTGGIRFRDLSLSELIEASVELTGSEGFRLIASPVSTSYADFLDPIWTQGITGADTEDGDPNVWFWGTGSNDWVAVSNLSNNLPAGLGTLVFVFDKDDFANEESNVWPKTLSVSGIGNAAGVSPSVNSDPEGFTLVGNPFDTTIDFNNVESTELTDVAYVWDPNEGAEGAWKSYDADGNTGDLTNGLIAPFQGFLIQTAESATSPSITFGEAAKSSGGTFYGKNAEEDRSIVRLELNGNEMINSTWLRFSEAGSAETTVRGDALKLEPLNSNYAQLAISKGETLFDISHLPVADEEYTIPVHISATLSGSYTLTATDFELPGDFELMFNDHNSGTSVPVTADFSYTLEISQAAKVNSELNPLERVKQGPVVAKASTDAPQYSITVSSGDAVSIGGTDELPERVALNQNYPNPFNPSTVISYDLPEASDVTIQVYDMTGRQVATLVSSRMEAGSHEVTFNAGNLASGVYIYRLQTGEHMLTRKLTLIK